jgi:hypothetical protein
VTRLPVSKARAALALLLHALVIWSLCGATMGIAHMARWPYPRNQVSAALRANARSAPPLIAASHTLAGAMPDDCPRQRRTLGRLAMLDANGCRHHGISAPPLTGT